jgi:hypothetical protein
MKKLRFHSFGDLKLVMTELEKHDIEFTWDFLTRQHELNLGHINIDHVKLALTNCPVPYKIIDYS